MNEEKILVGKTIIKAEIRKLQLDEETDDKPILYLKMSDGTEYKIISWYGGWTGESDDEYPRFISIEEIKKGEGK